MCLRGTRGVDVGECGRGVGMCVCVGGGGVHGVKTNVTVCQENP